MKVKININKPGKASGLIFVAPYTAYSSTMIGQTGALIMDQAGNPVWFKPYEIIKKLTAKKGFTSDIHEFTITKRNTALFTAIKQVPADLSLYGGPANGYFDNYSIQEVNLDTGELLFFWNVLDHVNPADSMLPSSSATSSNNI